MVEPQETKVSEKLLKNQQKFVETMIGDKEGF